MTVRGIPESVERAIRALAEKSGESLNRTILRLLEKSLGLDSQMGKKRDLSHIRGTWTEEDAVEFQKNTKIFDQIDTDIWE